MKTLKNLLHKQRLLSVATLGLRIANAGIGVLIAFFIIQQADAEVFGRYSVFIGIVSVVAATSAWGLPQYLARELAGTHLEQTIDISLIRISFAVISCGAIIASLGALSYLWFIAELEKLTLTLIASIALAISLCMDGATRGIGGLLAGQIVELLIRPFTFLAFLIIGGSTWGYTFEVVIVAACVSFVISACVSLGLFLYKGWNIRLYRLSKTVAIIEFKAILVIGFSAWLDTIAVQMPLLMIGWLTTYDQAASFRIAFYLVPLYTIALKTVNIHDYYEYSVAYHHTQFSTILSIYQRSKIIILLYYVAISLPAIIIFPRAIPFLVGEKVPIDSNVIITLILGILVTAPFGSINVRLLACKMERTLVVSQLIGLITSGGVALLLIPQHGALGAVLAYVVGYNVSKFSMAIALRHNDRMC